MPRNRVRALLCLGVMFGAIGVASSTSVQAADDPQQRLLGSPSGDPMQVPDNYTKFLPLMEKDPGHWGGAYADGDTLVIKVVNQSLDDAQVALQDVGVSEGVKLLSAGQSMDSLDATQGLVEKLLKTGSMEHVSSWGPDYRKSSIRVTTSEIIPGLQKSLDAARLPTGPAVDVEVSPGVPQTASRY